MTSTTDHDPAEDIRSDQPTALTWDAPGPGSWSQLPDHYPRPATASRHAQADVWAESFTTWIGDLGLPITAARMVPVNGLPYVSFEFAGGSESDRTPPTWLLRILVKVMPSMRRAERQAARVLAERPWVAGIAQWYDHDRGAAVARMQALSDVRPDELDDAALADHLADCGREELDAIREHHDLHAHDELPVLLFLLRMIDWGFERRDAFALLAGSSPVSTGSSPELEALRAVVGGRPATSIDELRSLGSDVAHALEAFLRRHGWRLVDGYDVDGPCLAEVPELVVKMATAPGLEPGCESANALEARLDAVRSRIGAVERAEFDRAVREARDAYGLRDDNGAILVAWPAGLVRRAMLESGRRLVARGELAHVDLAVEATVGELVSALRGVAAVGSDELAGRARHRRSVRASDAPLTLGPPEPPTPAGFPGAFGVLLRALELSVDDAPSQVALQGLGIGDQVYEGQARLVTGAGRGLAQFQPGEVLVAPMTSPSYNAVLSIAGAVVTEAGDEMSHAAIMARELALPAVIGAPRVTTEIADGDLVRVDPVAGTVEIRRRAST